MSDQQVVTRRGVAINASRILIGVATLLMAVAFCMCLGFLFDKKDILDILAVGFAGWTLFFLAHLV